MAGNRFVLRLGRTRSAIVTDSAIIYPHSWAPCSKLKYAVLPSIKPVRLQRVAKPVFYVFDLLWLNDKDLRRLPLLDRKRKLEQLIKKAECREILYAHHIVGNGVGLFEEICARDLEGIIAKRKRGVYRDDGKDWLKLKNPDYSRAEGRHDVLKHKRK
jgi:ATP-dependent DNA ligase